LNIILVFKKLNCQPTKLKVINNYDIKFVKIIKKY